jgi:hypothetical protein
MFETIHASFDRDEPFILPSRHYYHVRELLERSLDLRHTLINVVQLNAHAVIGARSCDDDTERRQNVAVVDRGIPALTHLITVSRARGRSERACDGPTGAAPILFRLFAGGVEV